MKRGTTNAETCRLNGWTVGTRLAGDEGYGPGYGPTVIRITAIGEQYILAVSDDHGDPSREGFWSLNYRNWTEVAS